MVASAAGAVTRMLGRPPVPPSNPTRPGTPKRALRPSSACGSGIAPPWYPGTAGARESFGHRAPLEGAHEAKAPVRGPRAVESLEPELAATGIAPQRDDVPPAEEAEPGVVEEYHRALDLHGRIRGAERERVLVDRPFQAEPGRLGDDLFGRDAPRELEQRDLPHGNGVGPPHGKVVGGHARVRVAVFARRDERLGRSAVPDRDPIARGNSPDFSHARRSPVLFDDVLLETLDQCDHLALFGWRHLELRQGRG